MLVSHFHGFVFTLRCFSFNMVARDSSNTSLKHPLCECFFSSWINSPVKRFAYKSLVFCANVQFKVRQVDTFEVINLWRFCCFARNGFPTEWESIFHTDGLHKSHRYNANVWNLWRVALMNDKYPEANRFLLCDSHTAVHPHILWHFCKGCGMGAELRLWICINLINYFSVDYWQCAFVFWLLRPSVKRCASMLILDDMGMCTHEWK